MKTLRTITHTDGVGRTSTTIIEIDGTTTTTTHTDPNGVTTVTVEREERVETMEEWRARAKASFDKAIRAQTASVEKAGQAIHELGRANSGGDVAESILRRELSYILSQLHERLSKLENQ